MISNELETLITGSTSPQLTEVYPVAIPQGAAYPAVRYIRITSDRDANFDEVENFVGSVYQIDSYAKTYSAAVDLAENIKQAINSYSGGTMQRVRLDFEADGLETDTDLVRVIQQYTIWHRET